LTLELAGGASNARSTAVVVTRVAGARRSRRGRAKSWGRHRHSGVGRGRRLRRRGTLGCACVGVLTGWACNTRTCSSRSLVFAGGALRAIACALGSRSRTIRSRRTIQTLVDSRVWKVLPSRTLQARRVARPRVLPSRASRARGRARARVVARGARSANARAGSRVRPTSAIRARVTWFKTKRSAHDQGARVLR